MQKFCILLLQAILYTCILSIYVKILTIVHHEIRGTCAGFGKCLFAKFYLYEILIEFL